MDTLTNTQTGGVPVPFSACGGWNVTGMECPVRDCRVLARNQVMHRGLYRWVEASIVLRGTGGYFTVMVKVVVCCREPDVALTVMIDVTG